MMISFLFKKVLLYPSAWIEKICLCVTFWTSGILYKLVTPSLSVVAVLKVRTVAA